MSEAERAILCVDDEEGILNSLKRLLRKEPYKIFTAAGGVAGLELLSQHPVQIVISDQRMPGMSGTQFLQEVKKEWPDTIRVILSGYAEADSILESINQGEVYRFLAKPWKDESLKATIRQCFDHYDMIQENHQLHDQTRQHLNDLKRMNNLLEASVETRTKSLQLAQEIVESMPLMILGISQEEELILANSWARTRLPVLQSTIPGTEISELMPEDAVEAIAKIMADASGEEFTFTWDGKGLKATPEILGSGDNVRGCVLLLEEVEP